MLLILTSVFVSKRDTSMQARPPCYMLTHSTRPPCYMLTHTTLPTLPAHLLMPTQFTNSPPLHVHTVYMPIPLHANHVYVRICVCVLCVYIYVTETVIVRQRRMQSVAHVTENNISTCTASIFPRDPFSEQRVLHKNLL